MYAVTIRELILSRHACKHTVTYRGTAILSFCVLELIDQVLEQDDLDKDGYLSYIEYVVGRQKDENKIKSKYNKP